MKLDFPPGGFLTLTLVWTAGWGASLNSLTALKLFLDIRKGDTIEGSCRFVASVANAAWQRLVKLAFLLSETDAAVPAWVLVHLKKEKGCF